MKKNIYLIRHGQTDFNLKKIVQGRGIDSDINSTGKWQAEQFYKEYKDIPFDAVYTSYLKRTFQTVEPFVESGLHHQKRVELDEINWGVFEGQKHDELLDEAYGNIIESWTKGEWHNKIEGGESAIELHERQKPLIDELRHADFENLLLCTHGRAIRALVCGFLDLPLSNMNQFPHSNTCLYKLAISNGKYQLEIANDISHLK